MSKLNRVVLIVVVVMICMVGALTFAQAKIACNEQPDGVGRWAWRTIEGRKCWFRGYPKQYEPSDLFWPTPEASPKTATEPERQVMPPDAVSARADDNAPPASQPDLEARADAFAEALLEHGNRRVNEMEFEAMERRAVVLAELRANAIKARSIEKNIGTAQPTPLTNILVIAAAVCLILGFLAAMLLTRLEHRSAH